MRRLVSTALHLRVVVAALAGLYAKVQDAAAIAAEITA